VTLRIIQRLPEDASAAERARPVGYLLRAGDLEVADSIARAETRGEIRVRARADVGRFRLIVTDRSVPGLVLITSDPTRSWQRLAAAGAGLLFVGSLAAIALLARWWGARGTGAHRPTSDARPGAAASRSSAGPA
jgi:hypothetical protein